MPRTRDKLHSSVSHLLEALPVASGSFKYPVIMRSSFAHNVSADQRPYKTTKTGSFVPSLRDHAHDGLSTLSCLALSIHLYGQVKLYHPSEDAKGTSGFSPWHHDDSRMESHKVPIFCLERLQLTSAISFRRHVLHLLHRFEFEFMSRPYCNSMQIPWPVT